MTDRDDSEAAFEQVLAAVKDQLRALFGPDGIFAWNDTVFVRLEREAVVFVVVTPFESDAVVNIRCYLARELDRADDALGALLCRLNAEQLFGAFSIDEDGDVCFDYSLLGSALTEQSLLLAIQVVAQAAERHSEEIIRRWGGVSSMQMLQRQLVDNGDDDTEQPPN